MGQHTWFLKNKDLFLKQNELYEKLNSFENFEIDLDDIEVLQIDYQIEQLENENEAEGYHDLFRTSRKSEDVVIFSRKECFEWINNPENLVVIHSDARKKLHEFWDKYPNGVIHFG
jgi:hypothetical protein